MERITSTQNPRIRQFLRLDKARERKEQNVFIIEGYKEINLALAHGYTIQTLFHCPEVSGDLAAHRLLFQLPGHTEVVEVGKQVFAKMAYRENSDGLVALARPRFYTLDSLELPADPFLIVLESVEKPGNLGRFCVRPMRRRPMPCWFVILSPIFTIPMWCVPASDASLPGQ